MKGFSLNFIFRALFYDAMESWINTQETIKFTLWMLLNLFFKGSFAYDILGREVGGEWKAQTIDLLSRYRFLVNIKT